MRIAACDDDVKFLQELTALLNAYGKENGCDVEYKIYTNPLELITQVERGAHYDVILLDVFMPGMNGIQCAKDIRTYDSLVKIIFLTSTTEFAVESYSVKAYQYLLKPIHREDLFLILKSLEKDSETAQQHNFVFKSKMGITKISLSKLEYCEVINRKIILHLNNGEECECSFRMNELEEKLKEFNKFLKPHRSFLINMDYIQTLNIHSIIMECGAKIPVPREKYAQIKQKYMEHVFQSSDSIIVGNIDG